MQRTSLPFNSPSFIKSNPLPSQSSALNLSDNSKISDRKVRTRSDGRIQSTQREGCDRKYRLNTACIKCVRGFTKTCTKETGAKGKLILRIAEKCGCNFQLGQKVNSKLVEVFTTSKRSLAQASREN
ncbi:hypothetical protein AVEN_62275-1 [Araneus ventricosus]|uniref:Uncharacterized protein n=1 Tax=Araneus ventricosus TaxID=182803 RepID=A0A4Y2PNS8_ARAVE|nr:hypothetical protein AVEN_62275-1 [Araneus ventricosus]